MFMLEWRNNYYFMVTAHTQRTCVKEYMPLRGHFHYSLYAPFTPSLDHFFVHDHLLFQLFPSSLLLLLLHWKASFPHGIKTSPIFIAWSTCPLRMAILKAFSLQMTLFENCTSATSMGATLVAIISTSYDGSSQWLSLTLAAVKLA